jgi:hypothetical protein
VDLDLNRAFSIGVSKKSSISDNIYCTIVNMKTIPKTFFALLILMISNLCCFSQDGSLFIVNSLDDNSSNHIAADGEGNVYVLGKGKSIDFMNADVHKTTDADQFYVAKINSQGEWLWANTFRAVFTIYPYKIRIGKDGDLYISGEFKQQMELGSHILRSTIGAGSSQAGFVAKLNKAGDWQWAVSVPSANSHISGVKSVVAAENGDCYITGEYSYQARFGSTTLTTLGEYAPYVAKLNKQGKWLWAVGAIASKTYGNARPIAMDINSKHEVYIFGITKNEVIFGSDTLNGNYRHFIAGIDSSGQWIEAITTTNLGNDGPHLYGDLLFDQNDDIFLAANYTEAVAVGDDTLDLGHTSWINGYVAGYRPGTGWLWAKSVSTDLVYGICSNITVDGAGNLFLSGFTSKGDTIVFDGKEIAGRFLLKMNNQGTVIDVLNFHTSEDMSSEVSDIVAISNGDIAFCGTTSKDITFYDSTYQISKFSGFIGFHNIGTASVLVFKPTSLIFYPNPTNGKIYTDQVNLGDIKKVVVYDALGKITMSSATLIDNRFQIEIPKQTGTYYIEIQTSNGSIHREKLIKY